MPVKQKMTAKKKPKKKEKKISRKLAIVDIETTGLHGSQDRIIELAVLRVEDGKIIDSFTTLINPQTYVSPFIEQFTGINREDLNDAPVFADIKDRVLEYLEDAVFVAHNARFDYGFMRSEFKRAGISWSAKTLCTVKLSRRLFPQFRRHGLEALIERFGFTFSSRHRAYDDAHIVWQFLEKVKCEVPEETVENAVAAILKSSYSGNEAIKIQVEDLPDSPGVYVFYDDKNTPLYVGKSKNLRERVISHFSQDYTSHRELEIIKNVSRIEHFRTAGELGALVEESRLIKILKPLHNRKLREKKMYVVVSKQKNEDGFMTLLTQTVPSLDSVLLDDVLGIYKSKANAKNALFNLAKTYGLCEKLMGLEKTKSSCFGYKLGRCKGACCGKENKAFYNGRFLIAFAKHQEFKPWPFSGPVEIIEKNDRDELYETFIIDNWKLREGVRGDEYINHEDSFDVDTYKIIANFLKYKKPNLRLVK